MAESQEKALEAHHIQTGLLTDEGNGEGPRSICCWFTHRTT